MLRKTIRRCGMLALVMALALAGVAPAAAHEIGGSRIGSLDGVWGWLADLFGFSTPQGSDDAGNTATMRGIWAQEGPGFDPNGQPKPNEGPGFDPNGEPH